MKRLAPLVLALAAALSLWRAASASITVIEADAYLSGPARLLDGRNLSELAFRFPAWLAGLACLWALWQLARLLFPEDGLGRAVLCGLVALHPLVLESFSLARGYSLGLASFLWALWLALRRKPRWERGAAPLLLLSVLAAPFLAVAALALAASAGMRGLAGRRSRWLVPPAFLAASLALRVTQLENHTLGSSSPVRGVAGTLGAPGLEWFAWLLPLVAVAALIARRKQSETGLFGWTLALGALAQVLLHFAGGVPFPMSYTGLALVPLLAIPGALWLGRYKAAAVAGGLLAAALLVPYHREVFAHSRLDADNRAIAERLAALPGTPLRIAANFPLSAPLDVYRRLRGYRNWAPVAECTPFTEAQVFVLRTDEPGMSRPAGLRVLRRYPRTGIEIAVR